MVVSGRKPHTSYSDIGLMTLTIDGPINAENRGITNENEKKCSLRQNRTSILGRGSEEYILSLREGTLKASTVNWVVPQPWDREWSFKTGGIFSPNQCVIADCKTALISENMQKPTDGSAVLELWADWSDNGNDFGTVAGDEPTLSADASNNYFSFFNVAGSATAPEVPVALYADVGDAFNVDVSANNFAVVFVIKTAPTAGTKCLLCMKENNKTNHFRVELDGSSYPQGVKLYTKGSSGSVTGITYAGAIPSDREYYIIVAGTENSSGTSFVRVNGTDKTTVSTDTIEDITLTSTARENQISIGVRENSAGYNFYATNTNFYEFHYLISSTNDNSFLSEIEKIEGGLARKFDILSSLDASHTYKTKVPHGSPIVQGANRYG